LTSGQLKSISRKGAKTKERRKELILFAPLRAFFFAPLREKLLD
jgi:hypothetical protein